MKFLNVSFAARPSIKLALTFFVTSLMLILGVVTGQPQQLLHRSGIGTTAPPIQTLSIKKVFAHYMVCCSVAGSTPTVEDFQQEIIEAQKRGLDGFALNCGGWKQDGYRNRVLQMYEAAQQLGTGFQLFISMDYCCGNDLEDTRNAFELFKSHPNQFRYDGKPVLSTFGGEDPSPQAGQEKIALLHMLGGVLIPYFFPVSHREHPTPTDITQLSQDYPDLDGYFYFGGAGDGNSIVHSNRLHTQHWLPKGKIFMAGLSPYYRSFGRLYETQGFKSMSKEWEGAIRDNVTWVQITTWNDWAEKSYVAPFGSVGETKIWSGTVDQFGPVNYSHVAYLDASRYYIDWFKTGVQPTIPEDKLFYFYRPEPKTATDKQLSDSEVAQGIQDIQGVDTLQDKVFATSFLTAPARLTIYSGEKSQAFDLPTGIQHSEMPYELGQQRFVLTRNGAVLIDQLGEFEIKDNLGISRYNYFAGSATAKPHSELSQ